MTHILDRGEYGGLTSVVVPPLLSVALFYSSVFMPPLGIVAPAPLYYSYVVNGRRVGFLSIGAAGVAAMLISGMNDALFFTVFSGLMAIALAESYINKFSLGLTLAASSMVPYLTGAAIFVVATASMGSGPTAALSSWAAAAMNALVESYKGVGANPELVELLEGNVESITTLFVQVFFGLALVSALFAVVINYLTLTVFSTRFGWHIHPTGHNFSVWKTPDQFVWLIIAGGFGVWLMDGFAQAAGMNLLLISCAIYLFHGLAIIHYVFNRLKAHMLLRTIVYFLVFSQPLLIVAISAVGLADVWTDFRKLDKPDEGEEI